jgi:hypothetical protein
MSDENERSVASAGSKPWKGSQSEGLHDLGMIVGLVCSATESLALAHHIAEVGGLLTEDKLQRLKEAEVKASSLGIASVSMARVAELHEKSVGRVD